MKQCDLEPSFRDIAYRKALESLIDYAEDNIEILSPNLRCINYPEVRHLLRKARMEGTNILAYYNKISTDLHDWLKASDIAMYKITQIPAKDYVISDRRGMIWSDVKNGYRVGKMVEYHDKHMNLDLDILKNDSSTKIINKADKKSKRIRIKETKLMQEDVEKIKNTFEKITTKVSNDVIPDKLEHLEESIRTSRRRFL